MVAAILFSFLKLQLADVRVFGSSLSERERGAGRWGERREVGKGRVQVRVVCGRNAPRERFGELLNAL